VAVCVFLRAGLGEGEYWEQLGGGYPGMCWSSAGDAGPVRMQRFNLHLPGRTFSSWWV